MKAAHITAIAYQDGDLARPFSDDGWLQAGFKSFAYRLAHLDVAKSVLLPVLASIFYLV